MSLCDIAVVGVGVMGSNLALNLASRGHRTAIYNRSEDHARKVAADHPEAKLEVRASLRELVASLQRPRRLLLMVPAGKPVDMVLDELDTLLETDDVVVDAGNSLYTETDQRAAFAAARPWRFVGMGVSGGAEGARLGPSMMPGGDLEAWNSLRPILESIAARSEYGPCVAHCGKGSAGHFVKMVHNGIEYGDMQLIAETAMLLRRGLGRDAAATADTFADWNQGDLESFLVSITAEVFRTEDPEHPGQPLIDAVLDVAGQKGTGRWTAIAALQLGVAIPTISAAVDARVLSAAKDLRRQTEKAFAPTRPALEGVSVDDLRDALYASKLASYSQGFSLLEAGSEQFGYGTDLAEVARIWTAGCILRAGLLGRVMEARRRTPPAPLLVLDPVFQEDFASRVPAWRRVVRAANGSGFPVPALSASLAWFDTLTLERGSASVIQAQRDHFGAHTYERVDRPGVAVHSEWGAA